MAIRIVSLAYSKGVPDLIGELVQVSLAFFPHFSNLSSYFSVNPLQENSQSYTSEGKSPKRKTDESSEKKKRVKKTGKFNDNSKIQTHTTPRKETKRPEAKTPQEKFDLPEDFTVILKNTDKKSWKEYQGPDGKWQIH